MDLNAPGAFRKAWQELQQTKMPLQKGRMVSRPILGLSVTAECAYTGLPAVAEDQDGTLLSAESFAKQSAETVKSAKERLDRLLISKALNIHPILKNSAESGHASFIAVVHVDGNGMGKRLQKYTEHEDNREMIRRMRDFSERLNQISLEAMQVYTTTLQLEFTLLTIRSIPMFWQIAMTPRCPCG